MEGLRKDIAKEAYIEEYYRMLNVSNVGNVTAIDDNRFKQALFAHWIRGTADFVKFKAKYKALANATGTAAAAGKSKKNGYSVIPSEDLAQIRDEFGLNPITVQLDARERTTVLVPQNLQSALFNEWPEKGLVIPVLGKFAKDMDLTINIVRSDGAQLVLRPPNPPAKGHQNAGYRYEKYGMKKETFIKIISEAYKFALFH